MMRALVATVLLSGAAGISWADEPALAISDAVVVEPRQQDGKAIFLVHLLGANGFPVTVHWTTEGLSAIEGLDYVGGRGRLVFDGSTRTQTIAVTINGDDELEGGETFLVHLFGASGATIADGLAHGVIEDYVPWRGSTRCDLDGDRRSDVLVTRSIPHPDIMDHYNGHEPWIIQTTVATMGEGTVNASEWRVGATNDFGGDGTCDLFWMHQDSSRLALTAGATASSLRAPGTDDELSVERPPSNWRLVGSGDFSADGLADLLWANDEDGALSLWLSDGTTFPPSRRPDLAGNPDPQWKAIATPDIDGDGAADILWRHATSGALAYWRMSGLVQDGGGPVAPGTTASVCSALVGTGDFNGDGSDDLLWQDQVSQVASVWFLAGPLLKWSSVLSPERFGEADPDVLPCPAVCQHDCSHKWAIVGPR